MTLAAMVAIGVFVVAYAILVTDKLNRALVALCGAGAMVALTGARAPQVFFSEHTGVDWNVIFLLFGMMVIVGVLRQTGVFEFLAIWSAQRAKGRPFRTMILLCMITAFASMMLDNVTTVLLIAPVTLLLCDMLDLKPIPFLIAEAIASNIGGTATLIGDPPNVIIASRAGLTFNDFLVHLAPIVLVLLAVFCGLAWLLWGRGMTYNADRAQAVMALIPRDTITDAKLLKRTGIVLALVLVGFVTHTWTHLEPSLVALLGAGLAILLARKPAATFLADVEWETLLFFAGLFVMVGALVENGVIGALAGQLAGGVEGRPMLAIQVVLIASAVLSGIVDNIPYVATMAPLVLDLAGPAPEASPQQMGLWWALALGADLGGNATAIGASANVVVAGIAKRNGHPISFWTFTRYGIIVTAVTIACCVPYLALRYGMG